LGGVSVLVLAMALPILPAQAQITITTPQPTLTNNAGTTLGGSIAIDNSSSIGTLSNSGLIDAGGAGVNNFGTITGLTNNAGGTIHSHNTAIVNESAGLIGTLSNNGLIAADNGSGIANYGSIGALSNSGNITGSPTNAAAINNQGSIGTLSNSGLISGVVGIVNSGTITSLSNAATGTIQGGATGINNQGSIGTLTNSGIISGAAYAINSASPNSTIGAVNNTGLISGNILVANQKLTIGGGANQGTLSGGAITIANGNLTFASGNQLLADSISVNGGAGIVTNNAILEVGSVLSLTGSFVQNGTYVEDITSSSLYGKLHISGSASFGGVLDVQPLGGMKLSFGEVFDVFNFASSSGDFSSFEPNGGFLHVRRHGSVCLRRLWDQRKHHRHPS
jgi:hypothetical protein